MSSASIREARRRKITERGSDRLALITGRIQTPPPSADSSLQSVDVSSSEVNNSSIAELLRDDRGGDLNCIDINPCLDNPESPLQKSRTGNKCEDEAPIFVRNDDPKPSLSSPVTREVSHPILHEEPPILELIHDPETSLSSPASREVSRLVLHEEPAILELNDHPETSLSSPASREVSHPVLHAEPPSSLLRHQIKSFSFSPNKLRSAVDDTANARMLCSVSVAILVVLSYMGFPIVGGKVIGSVLMFRPLYLVLLTNITLVVARMILAQQSDNARSVNGEGKSSPGSDNDWVNQIGNNLELGFLSMKVMDAVVMDCSLYSAIVVCGTCLARLLK